MKTTHQLAAELLALPDVEVVVEGWTKSEVKAVMTEYDPEGTAILIPIYERWSPASKE